MLVLGGGGVVLELLLLVYCVLNILTTPDQDIRRLPKPLWLGLVVVLPLVGGIGWLVAGRPGRPSSTRPPGRLVAPHPDDDEEFLRGLDARTQEQRRRAAEQNRADGDPA